MEKSPPPFIYARFEEKNILDCKQIGKAIILISLSQC
jgi:hypothetical protein